MRLTYEVPVKRMRLTYEVPVKDPTNKKKAFLSSLVGKFPKMIQWFLTIFERERLDFRNESLNRTRKIVKELCYPTNRRSPKYNCKGAIQFPHSHYYDTAITEAIQKWNSFLTWKEKSRTNERFPNIKSYAPVLDSTMFELDLDSKWITLKTKRRRENIHIPIRVPNKKRYEKLDEDKITSIRIKKRNNHFEFLLIQQSRSPKHPSPEKLGEQPLLGVDLGERNLASLVAIRSGCQQHEIIHVKFFDGAEAKKLEHREHHIRRKLQKQGKSSEIPKRKWKAKSKRSDECEQIARKIRRTAERMDVKAVFIGDLKAPKPKKFGALSRRLNNYPFARLKKAVKRHLEKAGIFVKEVYEGKTRERELGTSQECHKCGSEGERWRGSFSCPSCGLKDYNADLNAAINIVERGMKSLGMTEGLGAVP